MKCNGACCEGGGLVSGGSTPSTSQHRNGGSRNSFYAEEEIPDTGNFSFALAKTVSVVLSTHFHAIGFTVIVPGAAGDANLPMPEVASQDRKPVFLLFKTLCDLF